jgi:hypothetical protein
MGFVVRDVLQPRDEAGAPRRFEGHGEALRWISGSLASHGPKLLLNFVWLALLWLAWKAVRALLFDEPLELIPPEPVFGVIAVISAPLALWVLGTALLYGYVVLSGGVMSRAERDRARRPPRG